MTHQPQTPTRLTRRGILIAALSAVVLAAVASFAIRALAGQWPAIVVIVGGLLAAQTWFIVRTASKEHAALRRRFARRERTPVPNLARNLLLDRGIPVTEPVLHKIVAHWNEVGRFLRLDPRLLRADDDLLNDYNPDPPKTPTLLDMLTRNPATISTAGPLQGTPDPDPPQRCSACGYDLAALPPDAACPECGRRRASIRTLGDYLLFVCNLAPSKDV